MLEKILSDLEPYQARLVAVSKTRPPAAIRAMHDRGQRIFGENRAPELVEKHAQLPTDIEWHMIGHLQRNKVKSIVGLVSLIHSVDSLRLLKEIAKRAAESGRRVDGLLQFHVAQEESKYGLPTLEAAQPLIEFAKNNRASVRLCGIMGMASFTADKARVRAEFARLRSYFEELKRAEFSDQDHFKECSMGMSGDYKLALEEGSTMVRIGSLLFR